MGDGGAGVGGGAIERFETGEMAEGGEHLIDAGEGGGDAEIVVEAVPEVDFRDEAEGVVEAVEEPGDGEGAVVRRAEHDEAAALTEVVGAGHGGPAIGIFGDEAAGDEAAHGVGDEVDGSGGAEPFVDGLAKGGGGDTHVAAPVEKERADVPVLRERDELMGVVAEVDAGRANVLEAEASVVVESEAGEPAFDEMPDIDPDQVRVVGGELGELAAHDAVEDDDVSHGGGGAAQTGAEGGDRVELGVAEDDAQDAAFIGVGLADGFEELVRGRGGEACEKGAFVVHGRRGSLSGHRLGYRIFISF